MLTSNIQKIVPNVSLLLKSGVYEILKTIKECKEISPSQIVEKVKSISEKTVYSRLEEFEKLKIVSVKAGISDKKRPVKLYFLTPLGLELVSKLEELDEILKEKIEAEVAKQPSLGVFRGKKELE